MSLEEAVAGPLPNIGCVSKRRQVEEAIAGTLPNIGCVSKRRP